MRPTVFLAAACLGMVAACLPLAASSTSNQPVALVVATSGRVEVSRASSKSVERGTIGLALLRGDKVQAGAGGAATLLFSDGNLLELSEKSAITIGAHPRVARSREPNPVMADVFKSVSGGVVGGSRETGLVALAPARRPPGRKEIILAPRQTEILDERPAFRWRRVRGADRYRVVVSGEAGELWQRETGDTSFAYPADAAPLARETELLWTLHASNDSGPLEDEEASFRIKPTKEADAVRIRLDQIEKEAGGAAPYLAGAYLAGQGLLLDAIDRLESLRRSRPAEPGVHEALGQLYRAVGLMDLAAAELQLALTLGRQP